MSRGYDSTKPVRIWVGSYGLYNAGELVGDWFSLPMDSEELAQGIREACRLSPTNEEVGCFDYECDLHGVNLSEYTPIEWFNALAAAIENAESWEIDAAEAYISNESSTNALEAANILMDASNISYYSYSCDSWSMSKEEKYAHTIIEECDTELYKLLVDHNIECYFDYEAYGRDTDDILLEDGYLAANGDEPDQSAYEAEEILEQFGYYTEPDEEVA